MKKQPLNAANPVECGVSVRRFDGYPMRCLAPVSLLLAGLIWILPVHSGAVDADWPFEAESDPLDERSLIDLRHLNEDEAGQSGWIRHDAQGDFITGNGAPIRFWAVHSEVTVIAARGHHNRPRWGKQPAPDPDRHARWLAKQGVNLTRIMTYISPKWEPKSTEANLQGVEEIWRHVAAMKRHGIYTMITPYRATVSPFRNRLFFDEEVQRLHREWLRVLFRTPTPILGGKCLAEEPALAIYQIQNESALLFWNSLTTLSTEEKRMLGQRFGTWAAERHGSLAAALQAWGGKREGGDDPEAGVLDFLHIYQATLSGTGPEGRSPRMRDQIRFLTETQHRLHADIKRFLREELDCPVLISDGNWKSADPILLEDASRYSYTSGDVLDYHRYFQGIHNGKDRHWAISDGDVYTSSSALLDDPIGLPVNIKQVSGKPFVMSESAWVFPNEYAAEGPLLIAAYSSLTGFDALCWFSAGTETWTQPRSANGFTPSQTKWNCLTPDMAGLFPAAALAFRRGDIRRGEPVVVEHRSLEAIYQGKKPLIAEAASYDPNMDSGDRAAGASYDSGVSPYAFLAGPVEVVYDSDEAKTSVHPRLGELIQSKGNGKVVSSVTGELEINTDKGFFTVDTPRCQSVAAHFMNRQQFELSDVTITSSNDFGSVTVVSLDDQPIATSRRVLIQAGTPCRPTGWRTEPHTITPEGGAPVMGKRVLCYGSAPWQMQQARVAISIRNPHLTTVSVLDINGVPTANLPLDHGRFDFPDGAMSVILH